MTRDFSQLKNGPFDLLVIGGGIFGAWTACDAARRGLRVALVEKTDWGGGTSSASSKLIHGGLRYLEHYWFGLVKKSLVERKRLHALGPHRIRPQRFVLPVYQGDRVGRFMLNAGLWLYDTLAGTGQPVRRHQMLDRTALLQGSPFLCPAGLRGGFTYGDCGTDDARFALEIAAGAQAAGAAAVNYAAVRKILYAGGAAAGAVVEDREAGTVAEVAAACTVNAAGPWGDGLLAAPAGNRAGRSFGRLTKGVHLVMPPLPSPYAYLITTRSDRRIIFFIPWYGVTLLGTTDTDFAGDPDRLAVEQEDVSYLLAEANRAFARPLWSEADIRASFAGLRKLRNTPDRTPSATTREWVLEEPFPRLFLTSGGKLTSARQEAQDTVDAVLRRLGKSAPCRTLDRPFPWSPAENPRWLEDGAAAGSAAGLDAETAEAAACRYGSTLPALHTLVRETPRGAARIHPDFPFCRAEITHAARHETARTLEDILRRRIPLAILCCLDRPLLEDAARLAGEALGWSADRQKKEINSLLSA